LDCKCQLEELFFHLRSLADVVIHSHMKPLIRKAIGCGSSVKHWM
jgi:hypothetical protein